MNRNSAENSNLLHVSSGDNDGNQQEMNSNKYDFEHAKKSRGSSWMAMQRVLLKFHMMPRSIQLIFASGSFLIGISIVIFVSVEISSKQIYPNKIEMYGSRPNLPDKSRVIQLYQRATTDYRLNRVAEPRYIPGPRNSVEIEYNPLPVQSKLLRAPDALGKGDCEKMYDWQEDHKPTCNSIHEATSGWDRMLDDKYDWESIEGEEDWDSVEQSRLVAAGAFRQVWKIFDWDGKTKRALKTLRVDSKKKTFDLRSYDRHRRDAVSFEQLTSSPLIVDIYGYCTNSAIFDWGDQGTLEDVYERDPKISKDKLLQIAYNVSLSLAHAHNFDDMGRATLAHTDIKPDQFLVQDGYYKLTDFNRVRFLTWNKREDLQCGFHVAKNGGIWRSPEEYNYEIETEKVDVYSLGNILYFLLTKEFPWNGFASKEVYARVKSGRRPEIPLGNRKSHHPFDRYMIEALKMCYTQNQIQRPSAFEVAKKLQEGLAELKG
jgi:hypothetical protein